MSGVHDAIAYRRNVMARLIHKVRSVERGGAPRDIGSAVVPIRSPDGWKRDEKRHT